MGVLDGLTHSTLLSMASRTSIHMARKWSLVIKFNLASLFYYKAERERLMTRCQGHLMARHVFLINNME